MTRPNKDIFGLFLAGIVLALAIVSVFYCALHTSTRESYEKRPFGPSIITECLVSPESDAPVLKSGGLEFEHNKQAYYIIVQEFGTDGRRKMIAISKDSYLRLQEYYHDHKEFPLIPAEK